MTAQEELEIATSIAREAGEIILSYVGTDRMGARSKGVRDVVTAADTASERLVLDRLREAFPGDGVVAEEGGHEPAAGRRRWYVDPLDGTVNYAHGVPIWSVVLTLFAGDQPVLGVVHDPLQRETFTAASGCGARLNGSPIQCGEVTQPADALVHLTIDFNEASLWSGLEDIQRLAPQVYRTRNIGSAALALAYVAAGRFDAMLHRLANPWDYGAGVLLVREAGGSVTELDGEPYTVGTVALIAASTDSLRAGLLEVTSAPAPSRVE